MAHALWIRLLREIGLGLLALAAAAVVLLPGTWVIDRIFREGEYTLLIVSVLVGVALLLYQARLRPALREPVQRAAASLASALTPVADTGRRETESPSAFRVWGGVPIATLQAILYGDLPPSANADVIASLLCTHVRARAAESGALTWALREVGGGTFLLLQEPELGEEPLTAPTSALVASETYRHLWSANGPASYDEPIAFATVVRIIAVEGSEAALYEETVRVARLAANAADLAGVEVLLSESAPGSRLSVLLLAAGVARAGRRRLYRAFESAELTGLAVRVQRFDLLACDALAPADIAALSSP
jgi:hypothetical protein